MNTDEEKLITDNMNLVYSIAYKYYLQNNKSIELEDLQSIGFIGLIKASRYFNKDLGYAFSTYAYKLIKNEIINYIQLDNMKKINTISLYAPLSSEDNFELKDMLPTDYNILDDVEINLDIQYLYEVVNELPEKYRQVMLYLLEGDTIKNIAQKLNLSESNVQTLYNKALNILRYRFRERR